jgi:hypothetical protein
MAPHRHKETMDFIDLDIPLTLLKLPKFYADERIGKLFLRTLVDGKSLHVTVVQKIQDHDTGNRININFLLSLMIVSLMRSFPMVIYTIIFAEDAEDEDLSSYHKV